MDFSNLGSIPRIIAEERDHNVQELMDLWAQGYQSATGEQREILDTITSAVISGHGGLFFIDGPGGTGKTFVENLLSDWVRGNSQIALAVASSGIASNLLHHGRTSHSRFCIPLDIQPESLCAIPAQSELAELLRSTSLIIWDEVSSQNRQFQCGGLRSFRPARLHGPSLSGVARGDSRDAAAPLPAPAAVHLILGSFALPAETIRRERW